MGDLNIMKVLGVLAVLAVMIALWAFGSRFSTSRNNPVHFTDEDDDGAPDVPTEEKARARAAWDGDV